MSQRRNRRNKVDSPQLENSQINRLSWCQSTLYLPLSIYRSLTLAALNFCWHQSTLFLALAGAALLWFAYPPLKLSWLAYVALIPWIIIIETAGPLARRDYWMIWLSGSILWLALLQGIRLAFWPLHLGWLALSLYLAVFIPLFVGLSRVAVHQCHLPRLVALPVVWVGLECFRGYFLTGISICLLGHTQYQSPPIIQVADQFGCYGVSAVIVIAAVTIFQLGSICCGAYKSRSVASILVGSLFVTGALLYGQLRLSEQTKLDRIAKPLFRALLIQENSETIFGLDQETTIRRSHESWQSYLLATENAIKQHGEVDLVVWPESVFSAAVPTLVVESTQGVPQEFAAEFKDRDQMNEYLGWLREKSASKTRQTLAATRDISKEQGLVNQSDSSQRPTHLLVGSDLTKITSDNKVLQYNVALWIEPNGELKDYYAKKHLVMFGEYIPILNWFPNVLSMFRMGVLAPGERIVSFELNKTTIAPSICFENVLPHLIHRQIRQLELENHSPDVIITITNDGWFRGSSILDHHLANATLTAVENRRPVLIAANTGISAWIDGNGQHVAVSKRLQEESILAQPVSDSRWGLWQSVGDWPARLCALASGIIMFIGWRRRERSIVTIRETSGNESGGNKPRGLGTLRSTTPQSR